LTGYPSSKSAVIRAATRNSLPAADADEMLEQIESGYTGRKSLLSVPTFIISHSLGKLYQSITNYAFAFLKLFTHNLPTTLTWYSGLSLRPPQRGKAFPVELIRTGTKRGVLGSNALGWSARLVAALMKGLNGWTATLTP